MFKVELKIVLLVSLVVPYDSVTFKNLDSYQQMSLKFKIAQ